MIKPLEDVLDRVKSWPLERQADVARVLEAMEQAGTMPYSVSADERAAVEVGLEQAKRREFVSETDMDAFWNRHRT